MQRVGKGWIEVGETSLGNHMRFALDHEWKEFGESQAG